VWEENSKCQWGHWPFLLVGENVATPLWDKCEDETHIPKSGKLESCGTPENLELKFKGQNTLHWSDIYINGKVLKCICPKLPCMCHLDMCSLCYGQKKGRESNWQFDSRPLKVGNRPDFRHLLKECNVVLESSRGELQLWFGPHSSRRSKLGDMSSQSPGTPTRDSFGTPHWESREKEPAWVCSSANTSSDKVFHQPIEPYPQLVIFRLP
jgi:hypothetical protein